MVNYILRRIVQAIPVLFLVTAIVFLVIYFVPGDPAMVVLGQGASEANLADAPHDGIGQAASRALLDLARARGSSRPRRFVSEPPTGQNADRTRVPHHALPGNLFAAHLRSDL